MDYVIEHSPHFHPTHLALDVDCQPIRFSSTQFEALGESLFEMTGDIYDDASVLHHYYKNVQNLYEDPFLYTILENVGLGLMDVSIFGIATITKRCLLKLPNLRALRLYGADYNPYEYLPHPKCCKFLRIFECVGPSIITRSVVEALVHYGKSALRAVAIFNTTLCEPSWEPTLPIVMESTQDLGMEYWTKFFIPCVLKGSCKLKYSVNVVMFTNLQYVPHWLCGTCSMIQWNGRQEKYEKLHVLARNNKFGGLVKYSTLER